MHKIDDQPLEMIQCLISRKIKHFDICSLIRLLEEIGYTMKDIYFQSNPDLASRSTLCEAISFSEIFYPKVTIILNLGLLSVSSPLPSLFKKKMDSGEIDPIRFTRFLSFFDHHLIRNFLEMSLSESNIHFFSSWKETQIQYLKLLALNSISTVWFIMQICFPELFVQVIKSPRIVRLGKASMTLGHSTLGRQSFLGKDVEYSSTSFKVTLTTDEAKTELVTPWPIEIKKRLREIIFPLLEKTDIHLSLILVIRGNKGLMQLSAESHLGYGRIGESDQPLTLQLYSGYPRSTIIII